MSRKSAAKKSPVPKSRSAAVSNKSAVSVSRDFVPAKKAAGAKTPTEVNRGGVRVSMGIAPGGFTVYGSPIKPKRFTHEQIAAAVAQLD